MFDPTMFDNVKVVLEGQVYDHDLAGELQVTAREDLVDLASLSRTFRIAFRLKQETAGRYMAWMEISSTLRNIAAELLEQSAKEAGCSLDISFTATLPQDSSGLESKAACEKAEKAVKAIWGGQYPIEQQITHTCVAESEEVRHRIRLLFGRTFTEAVIDDLPSLVEHASLTLEQLG
ncbi:MAG: hypothetical protein K0Q90_1824 [Paenibacillaceae bacterium]|jgi:hypothetical protein|nr:hypothetical protein [Paenibacillaceae bacterium]